MEKPRQAGYIEQTVSLTDIDALLSTGDFLRARDWTVGRIAYLEKVLRELPQSATELETTDMAAWQSLRTGLVDQIHAWQEKLAVIERLIPKR